jgi:hypothetical protein
LAIDGGNLYVASFTGQSIGEYNESTGSAINASLITGIAGRPALITIVSVPEPSSLILLGLPIAVIGIVAWLRRRGGAVESAA